MHPSPKREQFFILVDGDQSLDEMIETGHYDSVDDEVSTSAFPAPLPGKRIVQMELVNFNEEIDADDAIEVMEDDGLRPARLCEVIAFGVRMPELQRSYTIVALGTVGVVDGLQLVTALCGDEDSRVLSAFPRETIFPSICHFLAVRG